MNEPVFVAGTGIISAIGNNTAACLDALEHGRAGMGEMQVLHSVHRQRLPVAEVKLSNEELATIAGLPSIKSRTALLSKVAATEALANAGIENLSSLRKGFISANSVGGMDKTENFFSDFITSEHKGRLHNVVNHECGSVTELVADALDLKDYVTTISTACSSSANAIFFAARLIRNNILDVAVAGGTDSLTRFTLNGFNTLM
ncbi:MAG TPA: beta-ketoacyl synthase N-terminal-like domain-containing protein, partial [Ferruginibacter sp.]|nr:beta-ketoacyl synthase N-terminal-like domain-containing protein [Ferruginibacter sp.]